MAVDNTHTKYLKGADKKAWENYAAILKAQSKIENYFKSLRVPDLKEGEEYEVPVKKRKNANNVDVDSSKQRIE